MKGTIISSIKRTISFILTLTIIIATVSVNVYATDSSFPVNSDSDNTVITYDVATGETTTEEVSFDYTSMTTNFYSEDGSTDIIGLESTSSNGNIIVGPQPTVNKVTDTLASPYRNICHITATFPDSSVKGGSATLVYFNVILTAAHLVYDSECGGWATSVEVSPARNGGNNPLGSSYTLQYSVPRGYVNFPTLNGDKDWAVCNISSSYDTFQLYGYYTNIDSVPGKEATLLGYPGDSISNNYMYSSRGCILNATDTVLEMSCTGGYGYSGGAILDSSSNILVGVYKGTAQNGSCTRAVRINEFLFNFLADRANEMSQNSQ